MNCYTNNSIVKSTLKGSIDSIEILDGGQDYKINDRLKLANPKYSLYNSLQLMLHYLNIPIEKNINATINELKKIDNRRNLDSSKIFTEIYNNQGN